MPVGRNGFVLLFSLGRISVYGLLGLVTGATGGALFDSLDPTLWRRTASAIAGISLVLTGLYLGGWIATVRQIDLLGSRLWRRMEPLGRRLLPVRTAPAALAAGLVWGWLPCGLVYYALLLALPQGNAAAGAFFMLAFGLGTLPGMHAAGMLGGAMIGLTRNQQVRALAAGIIVAIGVVTLLTGQTDIPHRFIPEKPGTEDAQHEQRY